MNITIRNEPTYTLMLGGEPSEGWREVSRWEGMAKLQRGSEVCMVEMPPLATLSEVFGHDVEATIVKASPGVLNQANRHHTGTTPDSEAAAQQGPGEASDFTRDDRGEGRGPGEQA